MGLLRRAIEQDWPEPEKLGTSQVSGSPGYVFARHFYAGFAGNVSEPVNEPSPREVEAAAPFVERLLSADSDASRVPEWGRGLGKLARQQRHPFPSLQLALRQLGDEFWVRHALALNESRAKAETIQRDALEVSLTPTYDAFLRAEEQRYQSDHPDEYARFLADREEQRSQMETSRLPWNSGEWMNLFDSDGRRLADFRRFFDLPDFWGWVANRESEPVNLSAL